MRFKKLLWWYVLLTYSHVSIRIIIIVFVSWKNSSKREINTWGICSQVTLVQNNWIRPTRPLKTKGLINWSEVGEGSCGWPIYLSAISTFRWIPSFCLVWSMFYIEWCRNAYWFTLRREYLRILYTLPLNDCIDCRWGETVMEEIIACPSTYMPNVCMETEQVK